MSRRYMRVILFFDLPSVTNSEKKIYRKFHSFLEKEGFIQMQESVYSKLAINASVSKCVVQRVKANSPKRGLVQLLVITEKQFSQIEYICGEHRNFQLDNEERLIIL